MRISDWSSYVCSSDRLYGREELARLAWYCLTHDSSHEVAGFTVRHAEMPPAPEVGDRLLGLPLTPFEILEERFPPDRYDLLIAIGPHQVNGDRKSTRLNSSH